MFYTSDSLGATMAVVAFWSLFVPMGCGATYGECQKVAWGAAEPVAARSKPAKSLWRQADERCVAAAGAAAAADTCPYLPTPNRAMILSPLFWQQALPLSSLAVVSAWRLA